MKIIVNEIYRQQRKTQQKELNERTGGEKHL